MHTRSRGVHGHGGDHTDGLKGGVHRGHSGGVQDKFLYLNRGQTFLLILQVKEQWAIAAKCASLLRVVILAILSVQNLDGGILYDGPTSNRSRIPVSVASEVI